MQYIYSILGALGSSTTEAAPGLGAVTITGHAPAIGTGHGATPGLGAVTVTGYAPSITSFGQVDAFPGLGLVGIVGYTPDLIGIPFTPPVLGAGDDSKALHWRKRDPRMRPVFSPVLRRKVSDDAPADAVEPENTGDDLYKDAEQRAAILEALDEHIAALRRENAARGLSRMARDAGRRQAADRVRQASERARTHASRAADIARRLAAGRILDGD